MHDIVGYTLTEKIHSSLKTLIYRGLSDDDTPVIIKVPNTEYPTLGELIRLRNQYTITKNLELAGIVKPLSLENYQYGFALIMEDCGGESLKNYITSKEVTIAEFLKIAIQIADTLEGLHQNRIIHKDIKPDNILINPKTGQVKIIDFSISSLLPRETGDIINPRGLEGTLAYMSPEQTGRMNRGIDYRTDFYSLGVTFYEMLTGQLPFQSTDPMELVHCHIALRPVPPFESEVRSPESGVKIPKAISDIVMKLVAKTAEDRYQSARGLKADLKACLSQWVTSGRIELLVLGQKDISDRFGIPEKLYGREAEIQRLMAAFDSVSEGTTEMMLVSGYSGIGKSALVHEVHKPIVRQKGYFISGKFEQFKRHVPFASLIQAFSDLIRQLLTESTGAIASWKEKLARALGANGQVIIDVIPEVEHLIGKQPAVSELGPTESQNRFNLVFQNFIRVFTQAEHPLVLFLDDLQWADSASLKLMQLLMTDPDTKYLFLIGAYRDNEVSPVHPLMLTLDNIKKTGAVVNQIVLQPLDIANLNRLVADALSCPESRAKPFSELVFQKTEGNPFFATQFLKSLYEDGLLSYDQKRGYWQCDLAKVKALAVSDNVVEFMADQLQKLPLNTQDVLKLAACIGNQFDLETLSIVYERSQTETAADLWKALQSGLVMPIHEVYKFFQDSGGNTQILNLDKGGRARSQQIDFLGREDVRIDPESVSCYYKFLHDRVQQAAYSLIPEADKKATHLKIGELLLKNTSPQEIEEKIFELVNQLNIGVELLASQSEKNYLAELNLIAGRKAKSATAYEPAVRYLNVGLGLLAADSWLSQYELTLDFYVEAVEAEYLNTNFERSRSLAEVALNQAKTLLEKVKVYEILIQLYIAQTQMQAALNTGLQALEMLGVSLEKEPPLELIIEDLINLPEMSNPYKLSAMRILMNLGSAVYIANPAMYPVVVFTMVNLCIKYGNSTLAPYAYVIYGLLLCGAMGDIDAGYRFGKLAVALLDQFDTRELKSKIYMIFNSCVRQWKEHCRETIEPLQSAFQAGIETGDIEYACHSAMVYCRYIFFSGEPLEYVEFIQKKYIEIMGQKKQLFQLNNSIISRQMVLNISRETNNNWRVIGESFNEEEMLPILIENNTETTLYSAYFYKLMLLYMFKNYELAVENARLAEQYEGSMLGLMDVAKHNFYYSLALLALYPNASPEEQQQYLLQVSALQEKMKHWAYHAPANFKHKYDLVEAEKARQMGQVVEAMELYDLAIIGAKNTGYIQEEALANELAAEFYLALGRKKIAQTYLTDSYYGYARWGAIAKVRDLEQRYPHFLARITSTRETPDSLATRETISLTVTQTTTSTGTGYSSVLDLVTVMKASLALSEEIVLDKLLAKLMKVAIENAGAQKGFFIMEKSGKLVIEAAGAIDSDEVAVLLSLPVENSQVLPAAIIHYVERTQENLVLNDAAFESIFAADPYIATRLPKSILVSPIINKGKRIGIIYLENNLSAGVFTPDRLEVLRLLSSQVAISLENALLYHNLQTANLALQRSEAQLFKKATELEHSLQELQQAQIKLVQSEKMSSLGQLVAGVAHEINNPVGFIHGNISHAVKDTQDILKLLQLYQQHYPKPVPEIQKLALAIDLNFVVEDLPKMLDSMKLGTDRIREIVKSLKNFSRMDIQGQQLFDIHEGLDSTLLILSNRMKACGLNLGIKLIKEYGDMPKVKCYAGQINQVFMNIIANAIDALDEQGSRRAGEQGRRGAGAQGSRGAGEQGRNQQSTINNQQSPTIRIRTEVIDGDRVVIRIKDNGAGMTEEVRSKLFDPFFTTKPVGKGTGLGLSISYQIVVEKHGGQLRCNSVLGEGTEFAIEIPVT